MKWVVAAILFMLPFAPAGAATYWVSATGTNASGTTCQNSSTPCRTITYTYGLVSAGDTINVTPGTYTDYTSGNGIRLDKSGSAGLPITLHSTVLHGAIIDGTGTTPSQRASCFYVYGAAYNTIDGFTIRNCQLGGISIWNSASVNSSHLVVTHNEIYSIANTACTANTGSFPCQTGQGGQGVGESLLNGNACNNLFDGNYIHNNGSAWDNTYDHGLYVECSAGTYINNLIINNNHGNGIQLAAYHAISNVLVANNTIVGSNGGSGWGVVIWSAAASFSNITVDNNIFYNNNIGIGGCQETGTNVNLTDNISFNNGSNYVPAGCGGPGTGFTNTGMIQSDPLFANNSSDWHLTAGSPGLGAGVNLYSTFTTDFSGATRPSSGAWDIGAYEASPLATATFVSVNTTTKGTWKGTYGADGYIVIAASKSIPAYVATALTEKPSPYNVWWKGCHGLNSQFNNANCTADARALQIPDLTYGRIAASYYSSPSLSFAVNMTDGLTHQMAIYALDWDNVGRAETIAITDTATGTPLDSRTLAANSFVNGSYVVWTIKGAVTVTVTKTAGPNAVVSGVFFN